MFGLMRPLKALTSVTSEFQRGMAACLTLFGLMDRETESENGKYEAERVNGEVEVKDVTFTYQGKENLRYPCIVLASARGNGRSG